MLARLLLLGVGGVAFAPRPCAPRVAVAMRDQALSIDTETKRQQALYDLIYVERLPEENTLPETGLFLPTDVRQTARAREPRGRQRV